MKVLLVNELGGGLGHLVPLMAVAAALGPAWHRRFVLPDPVGARALVAERVGPEAAIGRSAPWAPVLARASDPGLLTRSFADALYLVGLGQAARWRDAARFWSDLFDAERPDLVVTDAAPGARLAAAGRLPVVAIGNGYSTPPPGRLLPSLVSAKPDVPPGTRQREGLILAAANEVQAERDGPTLDFVADLFSGDATFVGTHPALDPYRAYRTGPTWWPCAMGIPPVDARREDARGVVFVYLHVGHPALEAVLDLVGRIGRGPAASGGGVHAGRQVHVYILGADPGRIASRCGPGVVVHDRPVEPRDLLTRTRLLVHHGGTRMCHEALAYGTAQLLLPIHLEHTLASRAVQGLGVGLALSPPAGKAFEAALRDGVARLLGPDVQAEARRRADELRASDFGDTLATIAETCRHLVGPGAGGPQ